MKKKITFLRPWFRATFPLNNDPGTQLYKKNLEIWPGSKNSHLLFNYSIKNHHIFKNGRTSAFIIYGGSPQKFYSTVAITHLSQGSPWPFAYCDVNAFWAFFFTFLNCCAFFVSTGPHVGHLWKNLTLGFSPKLLGGVPINVWKPWKNFGPKIYIYIWWKLI